MSLVESGKFPRHYLTARSPHRDCVSECGDVIHAGNSHLPRGALAGYPTSLYQAPSLCARVTSLDSATYAPPQQKPVNLLGELL